MTRKKSDDIKLEKVLDGVIDGSFDVFKTMLKAGVRAAVAGKRVSDSVESGEAEAKVKAGMETLEKVMRVGLRKAKAYAKRAIDDLTLDDESGPEAKK